MGRGRQYPAAAGIPVGPDEYRRLLMEQEQQQQEQNGQPEQAPPEPQPNDPVGGQAQLSAAEREALQAQVQVAREQEQLRREPIVIGTAPDGGPLRLDPNLISQVKIGIIGAGIGGLLVLIWWTRAVQNRNLAPAPPEAQEEKESGS